MFWQNDAIKIYTIIRAPVASWDNQLFNTISDLFAAHLST